jgi:hypothetical protein
VRPTAVGRTTVFREDGGVTLVTAAFVVLALAFTSGLARVGVAAVHRARADTAADAAALAAAGVLAAGGGADQARVEAGRLARANGAVLERCACADGVAEVTVAVGEAQARARAEVNR